MSWMLDFGAISDGKIKCRFADSKDISGKFSKFRVSMCVCVCVCVCVCIKYIMS